MFGLFKKNETFGANNLEKIFSKLYLLDKVRLTAVKMGTQTMFEIFLANFGDIDKFINLSRNEKLKYIDKVTTVSNELSKQSKFEESVGASILGSYLATYLDSNQYNNTLNINARKNVDNFLLKGKLS